jgi:glycerate 2-kinase
MTELSSKRGAATPPQTVLIAPDKFKGTMTAKQVGAAIRSSLQQAWPNTRFTVMAIADGGEGFAECLVEAQTGRFHEIPALDALGRPCIARWGEIHTQALAVVDIASASGLAQIPLAERSPELTSTQGTGIVLRDIIAKGLATICIGLGGSATNDAGIGIASELGFRFLDTGGRELASNGAALKRIARIESPRERIDACFVIATDVDHPLYGANGAAFQFAAQKGASEAMVRELDEGLRHFASIVTAHVGKDFSEAPGAGAAGGAGFGMMALLQAERRSGFDVLREQLRLDDLIERHDLIITGEGCFDHTSLGGKAPTRIAQLAREKRKAIWGVFGRCEIADAGDYFDRYVTVRANAASLPQDVAANIQLLSQAAARLIDPARSR